MTKRKKQFTLENAFNETKDGLEEIAPAIAAVGSRLAPTLGKIAVKAAPAMVKDLDESEAREEDEPLAEILPALAGAAASAVGDKVADSMFGEDDEVNEAISGMFEAQLSEKEDLEEDGYPEKGDYPQQDPVFPKVHEAAEELEEDGYPNSKAYPADKPQYPRVVEAKGARFMVLPLAESSLNENPAAAATMLKGLVSQAGKVLSQVDAETISDVLNSFTQMAQGIMNAKQQMGRQTTEGLIRENEMESKLHQVLSKMPIPPGMTDQEIEAFGTKVTDILKTNRQLGSAKWDTQQQTSRTDSPLPQDPASWKADSQMRGFKSLLRGEGKTYKVTKGQLKELMKEAVLASKKKVFVEQVVAKTIKEQVEVRNLAHFYLTEGPLSAMWQGAKNVGRGLAGGAQQAIQGAAQGAQQAMSQGREQDQTKQAQKVAQDALKAVSKAKDKFSQETLKSSNLTSQYHDAVMNLATQVIPQLKGVLPAPALMQLKDQIDQAVGQLHYDLSSEKEGIDTFLNSLQQNVPYANPSQQGKQAKARAEKSREEESEQYGQTQVGRGAASPGLRRR